MKLGIQVVQLSCIYIYIEPFCRPDNLYFGLGIPLRLCLLLIVVTALHGVFIVEQPEQSVLEFFPPFQDLLAQLHRTWGGTAETCSASFMFFTVGSLSMMHGSLMRYSWRLSYIHSQPELVQYVCRNQVFRAKWYMAHYGGLTPKPHYAWSNSPYIVKLNAGRLVGWRGGHTHGASSVKTCAIYKNKKGETCYKGTRQLRKSE